MASVWMRLRAELRARWRATVMLALLLGLVGGGTLAAVAGARRTQSAYPRFVERYRGFDVAVSTGGHEQTPEIFERIAGLPMVIRAEQTELLNGEVLTPTGRRVGFPDVFLLGEPDEVLYRTGLKVLDGRASDPDDPAEAMVAYGLAERPNLRPGDRIDVELVAGFGPDIVKETVRSILITGTYAAVSQFETVTGTGFPTVLMVTPAFVDRHRAFVTPNEGQLGVVLEHGEADLPAFRRALEAEEIPYDSITPASLFTPGVQRLNRIPQVALWILAAALAITGLAVVGQALAREAHTGLDDDRSALAALGMSRVQISGVGALRVVVVAVAGAALSVPLAIALSPLMPIGLARIAEPDPGIAVDPLVVGLGAVGICFAVLGALTPSMLAMSSSRRGSFRRPSVVTAAVARSGAPVSSVAGVGMALEPGRGARAIPSRSAMLGAALAIAALVAAFGFDRSFARLQADPSLAGYVWDAAVITLDPETYDELIATIEDVPGVDDAFRGTIFGAVSIDGVTISAVAYDGYSASVVTGRAPAANDEVMLDGRTMRALGIGIGDTVTAAPPSFDDDAGAPGVPMTVVGRFIFPRLPFQASENPEQGAFLTFDGLARTDADTLYEAVYVRFGSDSGPDPVASLRAAVEDVAFAVLSRSSAATVRNVARLSDLPLIIAAILGALGAAALVHALGTAIRRRRKDLAILKTLGFTGGQVRATVAWQSTSLVLVGLAVGTPVGVVLGRWGWRMFADELDVVPAPVTSIPLVLVVVVGAIVLANFVAALPARAAARTQPAGVLRSE